MSSFGGVSENKGHIALANYEHKWWGAIQLINWQVNPCYASIIRKTS